MTTKPAKGRMPIAEFAKHQKPTGVECWMCGIPERAEIEQAVRDGVISQSGAARYLRDICGYPEATLNRVRNHLVNHAGREAVGR